MTAAEMQTGQASDLTGDGGMTAGGKPHGQQEYTPVARGAQVLNMAALDMAALAAASVLPPVSRTPSGNGSGPHEPAPKFAPLHAGKLKDLPPVAWLIKGEIPKLGLTLIYGPTGAGKSFVTLDYAFQIARTRPVVYVAAEGAAGYAPRVLAWTKHHHEDPGQLYFIPHPVNLLDPNDVDAFLSAITQLSPELVIVDTLARSLLGGDENSAKDMGLAVEAADHIKRAIGPDGTGGAVILVHHSTKAGNTERGSGALKAACDQVIRLDNDGDLLTMTCEKSKDAAAFDPHNLTLLLIETGRQTEDGDPETSRVVIPSDQVESKDYLSPNGRKLLETLAQETFKETGGRASVLIEVTGMKPASFYRTASALIRNGYARQHEKGDPYFITSKGELAITIKLLS